MARPSPLCPAGGPWHSGRVRLPLLALLAGCPPDPGAPGGGVDSGLSLPLAGDCPSAERLGGFRVEVTTETSGVQGTVSDGVLPGEVLQELSSEGACVLQARANPICEPPCESGQLCGLDGACVDYPRTQDLGTVTLQGLRAPVVMEPVQPGNSYYDTSLPHPAFDEGADISLSAAGLQLRGQGGAALIPAATPLRIVSGQALDLAWTPPVTGAATHLRLVLSIDQHGQSPRQLTCDFADTGQGTVPAGILAELVGAGVSGWPSARLRRRTADSATVQVGEGVLGCVDIEVAWATELTVEVDGHTPCSSDLDCPDGQSCDLALASCV